jgi:tetratricopeptide (TPR) repeat protein
MGRCSCAWGRLRLALPLVALMVATTAQAQDGSIASQAEVLIDEGVALRRAGDDEAALARFQAANDLFHSARAWAQIALVEQALGRWIDAEAHLREALASHEPWIEERRETLAAQLEVIRGHLGRLEVSGGVRGATITVNGTPAGALPLSSAVWVEPGAVVVEVVADGFMPFAWTGIASAGEVATLHVRLETDAVIATGDEAEDAAPAASVPPSSSPLPALGWAAVGTGAAGLVLSAIALGVRNAEAEAFNGEACLADGMTRGENCRGHYDAALAWESTTIGAFVAGLVLAGGGVALVLVGGASGEEQEATSTVACVPVAGDTWGAACHATF